MRERARESERDTHTHAQVAPVGILEWSPGNRLIPAMCAERDGGEGGGVDTRSVWPERKAAKLNQPIRRSDVRPELAPDWRRTLPRWQTSINKSS